MLSAAIAFLAVVIAYGQWHTARQKLVLDLFDKRFAAYDAYYQLLNRINDLNNRDPDALAELDEAGHRVRYLFGSEITDLTAKISGATYTWHQRERAFMRAIQDQSASSIEIDQLLARASEARESVSELREALEPLLRPYLRMVQRLPVMPGDWLKLRRHNRPDGT